MSSKFWITMCTFFAILGLFLSVMNLHQYIVDRHGINLFLGLLWATSGFINVRTVISRIHIEQLKKEIESKHK
jgi:hypothetical protein